MTLYSVRDLTGFRPQHDSLVGIDSDGCVFDTMEIKQKRFFQGRIVGFWNLGPIKAHVLQAAEFVNLGSRWRGSNRFVALLKVFDLLWDWPEARGAGVALPERAALRRYVESGLPLSEPSLEGEVARTGDPELERLLAWSQEINRAIGAQMPAVPPFKGVRECLDRMAAGSDLIVVSQTPEEALFNEWRQHALDGYVAVIGGQELGTKAEQVRLATTGRYAEDRALLVGDSLNDLRAAREAGALFFPIKPGAEPASWKMLLDEGYGRFLNGTFAGVYQRGLIREFETLLPEIPPFFS